MYICSRSIYSKFLRTRAPNQKSEWTVCCCGKRGIDPSRALPLVGPTPYIDIENGSLCITWPMSFAFVNVSRESKGS